MPAAKQIKKTRRGALRPSKQRLAETAAAKTKLGKAKLAITGIGADIATTAARGAAKEKAQMQPDMLDQLIALQLQQLQQPQGSVGLSPDVQRFAQQAGQNVLGYYQAGQQDLGAAQQRLGTTRGIANQAEQEIYNAAEQELQALPAQLSAEAKTAGGTGQIDPIQQAAAMHRASTVSARAAGSAYVNQADAASQEYMSYLQAALASSAPQAAAQAQQGVMQTAQNQLQQTSQNQPDQFERLMSLMALKQSQEQMDQQLFLAMQGAKPEAATLQQQFAAAQPDLWATIDKGVTKNRAMGSSAEQALAEVTEKLNLPPELMRELRSWYTTSGK